jgi:hypothetical protein
MTAVRNDLRLERDESPETPIRAVVGDCRYAGILAYQPWVNQTGGLVDSFPTPITLHSVGHLPIAGDWSSGASVGYPIPHETWRRGWTINSLAGNCFLDWEQRATPEIPDPSGRIHHVVLSRKLAREWQLSENESARSSPSDNPAILSIRRLSQWLQLTQADVLITVGVNERTFYHWQKYPQVQPRLVNIERLSRVHALVEALVEDIGIEPARKWFKGGSPSRLTQIRVSEDSLGQIEDQAFEELRARSWVKLGKLNLRLVGDSSTGDATEFASREIQVGEPLAHLILPDDNDTTPCG